MRSRTELMFQVATEICMGKMRADGAGERRGSRTSRRRGYCSTRS
jgi:hypothetical protein